jgi:hypothetical protein
MSESPEPKLPGRPPMTLQRAMAILAEVHTRPDDEVGFTVTIGAIPDRWSLPLGCAAEDYIEAWRVLREQAAVS